VSLVLEKKQGHRRKPNFFKIKFCSATSGCEDRVVKPFGSKYLYSVCRNSGSCNCKSDHPVRVKSGSRKAFLAAKKTADLCEKGAAAWEAFL
jgi:hypothetical protein